MSRKRTLLGALLMLIPCVARADVGTPLVWATAFHMLLGNAILGVCEGWLLAKVFDLRRRRCVGIMVLANYLSAWVGMFIVDVLAGTQTVDIYNALRVSLTLIFITYLLTLILEWPFVALCFWRSDRWLTRSIRGSLIVQTASYALLFGGFWLVSGKSLYTSTKVVPPRELSLPDGVQVFYIASSDGDVYRLSHTNSPTRVCALNATNVSEFLMFQESRQDTNLWDLVAVMDRRRRDEETIPILSNALRNPSPEVWRTQQYWGWGTAPKIGTATNSQWHFAWSHWNDLGMWGGNDKTGERISVAFGTPVMGWPVWRAIHLPSDEVLFQLGNDQLCLLDTKGRRVAMIARGHGPVATTDEELSNQAVVGTLLRAAPHR